LLTNADSLGAGVPPKVPGRWNSQIRDWNFFDCLINFLYATSRSIKQGSIAMNERMSDLGELEREVMQLVWDGGDVTADAVRTRLDRKPKESTVRTVLRRLEDKGYVTHAVSGRTFVFRAVVSRGDVAARAVKHIVDWFCNGSLDEVLVGMADARMLDSRTLQMLRKRIANAKAKGGK
jgi:BlaI family penicillinase repressor